MRNLIRVLYLQSLFLVFFIRTLSAQDPGYSQFEANKIYLNPATAGSSVGLNINANYRSQWDKINLGFQTPRLSVDAGFNDYVGMSFFVMQDNEGNSLKTTQLGLGISGGVKGETGLRDNDFSIKAGIMVFYVWKNLNMKNLIFSDQLDQVHGYNFQSSSFPMSQDYLRINYLELSGGINFRYINPGIEFEVGASVHHWPKPKQSFVGLDTKLTNRYTIFGNSKIYIKERYLYPFVSIDIQSPFQQFLLGANTNLIYPNIIAGLAYRQRHLSDFKNIDALIFTAGYQMNFGNENKSKRMYHTLKMIYSYDMTISRLSNGSGGTHEITLSYSYGSEGKCGLGGGKYLRFHWRDNKILAKKSPYRHNKMKSIYRGGTKFRKH
jgi:type IX secretion system PorP/SprF family membrane protein